MIEKRHFFYGNNKVPVNVGGKHTTKFFKNGKFANNGACETASFTINSIDYKKSVEEVTIDVTVGTVFGRHDVVDGNITFFTNNIIVPYSKGSFFDIEEGKIIWNKEELRCEEQLSEIYYGEGKLWNTKNGSYEGSDGSMILIENESEKQYIGLRLTKRVMACGVPSYSTQLKGIIVHIVTRNGPVLHLSFYPGKDQKQREIASQMHFLHMNSMKELGNRFNLLWEEMCVTKRNSAFNKLQAISGK